MKSFLAFFIMALAFAAVASALDEGLLEPGLEGEQMTCEEMCFNEFGKLKEKESQVFCKQGCRLLRIVDGGLKEKSGDVDESDREATVLRNCEESCDLSFSKEKVGPKPCKKGCHFEAPFAQKRRNDLKNQEREETAPGFMGSFPHAMIRIQPIAIRRISLPGLFGFGEGEPRKEEEGPFSSPEGDFFGGFRSMVEKMHRHMANAMSQMISENQGIRKEMERQVMEEQQHEGEEEEHHEISGPRGRVVVFQSGPGYTKEKTIDFGPDGVKTRTHTTGGERFMGDDDMMSENNPLEKFFKNDDVEVFKNDDESDDDKDDFAEDFSLPEKNLQQEAREHRLGYPAYDSAFVNGFDFNERPHLPENGLQSGHRIIFMTQREICNDSSDSSWSEWVHCLHVRMGLPRWLMACSMALGIVFIIWLCFAIPQNAPKQRLIKSRTPKNMNVQEIQAPALPTKKAPGCMTVSAITSSGPPSYSKLNNDFPPPPAYDEASLKVKIPAVHEKADK